MAAVAVAASIIGAAVSAVGAIKQGDAAKAAANYNAQLAERNATIARNQAQADAEAQRRKAAQFLGSERAAYGATGVDSSMDVLESSAAAAKLDEQNILYKGEIKALGYEGEAVGERFSGSVAKEQSYYGAASALLSGAGQAGAQYQRGQSYKAKNAGTD